MMELFSGFAGASGTHGVPTKAPDRIKWEIKSTAQTLREPVTVNLWEQHLAGTRPLGVITIREDGMVMWASIDYDVYDADLLKLIENVERLKLPLVPVRSKSGGLHLFLFMQDWTSAAFVQPVLRDIAAQLGLGGCEIFPRQTKVLAERGDMGNWMVMPYYGQTYGGKIQEQVGLKKTGAEMSVVDFLNTAERMKITEEDLAKFVRKRGSGGPSVSRGKHANGGGTKEPAHPFEDGPPCLQTMAQDGVGQGYQNNALLHMGVYYKRKYPMDWQAKLEEAGRSFLSPPSTSEGMQSVIKSLEKRDYQYTCKVEPMQSHCNSALCRSRQYGVGDEGAYPIIHSLSRLESDPPVWFVAVSDGKGNGDQARIACSTQELQTYALFQRLAMDHARQAYCSMAQKDWASILNTAFGNLESLPMPESAGDRGMFRELLEEFLTNRQRGESLEDLFTGRPWHDAEAGVYYFRLRDLHNFVQREGMKDSRAKVGHRLYEMNSQSHQFKVKGKTLRCMSVSQANVEAAPDLPTKKMEDSPI